MTNAPEKPLTSWRSLLIGLALGGFVGSILAATALNIAAVLLIVMFPTSPWGWTLGAAVVSLGPASLAEQLRAGYIAQALVVQQLVGAA